jgi:hypothetical protein
MIVLPDGPMRQRLTAALPVLIAELPAAWHDEDAALALQIMAWLANEQVRAAAAQANTPLPPGNLRFVKQKGMAMAWAAIDVHPLQDTETAYRAQVRRAGDAAVRAQGEEARKDAQWQVMQQYFRFVSVPQALTPITPADNPTPPLVEDQLRIASRELKRSDQLARVYQAVNGNKDLSPVTLTQVKQTIEASRMQGTLVMDQYQMAERELRGPLALIPINAARPTILKRCEDELGAAEARIRMVGTGPNTYDEAARATKKALASLETAGEGLATTQSIYFIDGFYLFRLLVRYRYESDLAISDELKTQLSDALTKLLHNNTPWLRDFLRWAIADLNTFLSAVGGDNLLFFLKGGRALEYALGDWTRGTNDWDTQLVINPSLPPDQWYRLFNDAQNVVIQRLSEYRRRFMMLLAANTQALVDATCPPPPAPGPGGGPAPAPADDPVIDPDMDPQDHPDLILDIDDEPISSGAFCAPCKAELIDVGAARRDSPEAIEQWRLVKGRVVLDNGVPIPPPEFFMVDFLIVLREVLAGTSHSVHKATKRVKRLYQLLSAWDESVFGDRWIAEMSTLLPLSTHLLSQFPGAEVRKLGWFSLWQFSVAYQLQRNSGDQNLPGLSDAFDLVFSGNFECQQAPPGWPPALNAQVMNNLTPGEQSMFLALGSVAWISTIMEAHFVQRAHVLDIANPAGDTMRFIQGMSRDVLFGATERTEIKLGVSDALAAALHADALARNGAAPIQGLEPVDVAAMRVMSVNTANAGGIIIGLLTDRIQQYLMNNPPAQPLTIFPSTPAGNRSWMALRLEQEVDFGTTHNVAFKYAPNLVIIDADPVSNGWPMLDALAGVQVLTLSDLAIAYRRRLGSVDEYGRREVLHHAQRAVLEMLTDYEAPANPVHLLR